MKITLSGVDGLLKALSGAEVKSKIGKAVQKNGAQMHKAAISNAPVDTGALKQSITLEVSDMTATVQENKHYGIYVELGTRKMAAQPYIKPAFNSVKDTFVSDLRKAVR